jgi:hypothetical protein
MPSLERPIACFESPFCAVPVAVNLDYGGVDHRVFHIRVFRNHVEKSFENIGLNPIAIAFENGVPFAKKRRKVAPRTSRSRNPQHGLNK